MRLRKEIYIRGKNKLFKVRKMSYPNASEYYIHDARRVFGQRGVDWQEQVNFERLRKERLERARAMMKKYNFGAFVCFNNENIRYITSTWQGQWKANIFVRYCVLPEGGDPVLFETAGADMQCALIDAPWLKGNIKPAITWIWSGPATSIQAKKMAEGIKKVLEENGVAKEKIGVDMIDWASYKAFSDVGLDIANAWPALSEARVVKTRDELELCKQAAAIAGCAFDKIRNEWLKPGVRECEIAAKYAEFLLKNGFEFVPALIVASGRNTNPYRRWATDKIIQEGDLVIVDIAAPGPSGYFEDITRTFICGKPTEEAKEAYRECYDSLNAAIKAFKPGATTREIAENFPYYDDDKFGTCSLFQFAHSIGLSLYEGLWVSRGYSLQFPEEIKKNMYFAVETYSGNPKRKQAARLEQNLVVTETGHEIFSTYPFEEELLE